MEHYVLAPIQSNHQAWGSTLYRPMKMWTIPRNEREARNIVATVTRIPIMKKPKGTISYPPSPWEQADVTSCHVDTSYPLPANHVRTEDEQLLPHR